MAARGKPNGTYQGMKWIRSEKRLALYLRDNLACVYCGQGIEVGIRLTLDHLIPYIQGGSNQAENLVSCCLFCNSSRSDRNWKTFARSVATYRNRGITAKALIAHIEQTRKQSYDVQAAHTMIERRGNFSQTIQSLRKNNNDT